MRGSKLNWCPLLSQNRATTSSLRQAGRTLQRIPPRCLSFFSSMPDLNPGSADGFDAGCESRHQRLLVRTALTRRRRSMRLTCTWTDSTPYTPSVRVSAPSSRGRFGQMQVTERKANDDRLKTKDGKTEARKEPSRGRPKSRGSIDF